MVLGRFFNVFIYILPYLIGAVSVLKTDIKKCDSTALTTCFYTVRGGAINKKEAGWKTGPPCYFY